MIDVDLDRLVLDGRAYKTLSQFFAALYDLQGETVAVIKATADGVIISEIGSSRTDSSTPPRRA
jgi:hypothetical protein